MCANENLSLLSSAHANQTQNINLINSQVPIATSIGLTSATKPFGISSSATGGNSNSNSNYNAMEQHNHHLNQQHQLTQSQQQYNPQLPPLHHQPHNPSHQIHNQQNRILRQTQTLSGVNLIFDENNVSTEHFISDAEIRHLCIVIKMLLYSFLTSV